jgi:hypothetical protein
MTDTDSEYEKALGAVVAKIHALADSIPADPSTSGSVLRMAAAVNQLAEASAWLRTAAQPHGGSGVAAGE